MAVFSCARPHAAGSDKCGGALWVWRVWQQCWELKPITLAGVVKPRRALPCGPPLFHLFTRPRSREQVWSVRDAVGGWDVSGCSSSVWLLTRSHCWRTTKSFQSLNVWISLIIQTHFRQLKHYQLQTWNQIHAFRLLNKWSWSYHELFIRACY